MAFPHFALRSERAVIEQAVLPRTILVRDGLIEAVESASCEISDRPLIDVGSAAVLPGLVDTHVHVNEPGRTEWEGFETATRAAAAGGVTTIVDMPLNSIPATVSVEALRVKRRSTEGKIHVDVGFWGGLVPSNVETLAELWDAGVLGFKAFLSPSGVEEFSNLEEADLDRAFPSLAELDAPLLVHAEWPAAMEAELAHFHDHGPSPCRSYARYLASRPPKAERAAIALLAKRLRRFGGRVHIVHAASEEAIDEIQKARNDGLDLTAETCPHYLTFAAEEIADGATQYKCAPPIRERKHREALWRALGAGGLDLVATDHSPSPPALKNPESGDVRTAWGGIASLQLLLPAVWTEAQERGFDLPRLARWLATEPARLAGLARHKGRIAPGLDADFVVVDPESRFRVEGKALYHRHPITPYDGRTLAGRVLTTFLRGHRIWQAEASGSIESGEFGESSHRRPVGRCLLRSSL